MSAEAGRFGVEREAVAALWGRKRVWLLHLVGNAALAGLAWAWLWIPDARGWQVAGSALLGLGLVAGTLWLHGSTLALFRRVHLGEEVRVRAVFAATLRRLPALGVWAGLLVAVLALLAWVEGARAEASAWLGSALTLVFRRPVSPELVGRLFSVLLWLATWGVTPVVLLPLEVEVAHSGFRGFAGPGLQTGRGVWTQKRYWMDCVVLFLVGAYLPYRLVVWVPEVSGFAGEVVSLLARLLAAYLLTVTAWLVLTSLLGRWASGTKE